MKRTIQLGVISSFNILIAFLFQWYVLVQIGPGPETDALFASMTLPQLLLAAVAGSLSHALIPLLSGEDEASMRRDAWSILYVVMGLFCLLALLLLFSASLWVPLTVPGFTPSAQALATELTRIQLVAMLFTVFNSIEVAVYHARERFLWTELSPLLTGIPAFGLLIWALPEYGVVAAAWIAALRVAVQALLLLPGMGRPVFSAGSSGIRLFWHRAKPLLLGSLYFKSESLIDRFLLSSAASGSLSLYYFSQKIYGAAQQVINKAMSLPLAPRLSIHSKNSDQNEFRRLYRTNLWHVTLVSLSGGAAILLFGRFILRLLAEMGNFDATHIDTMWWMLVWLLGMFLGGAVGQVCSSAFYARGDTRTPTNLTLVTYTLYIPVKVYAFTQWSIMGLALATSFYYMTNLLLKVFLLERNPTHANPRHRA